VLKKEKEGTSWFLFSVKGENEDRRARDKPAGVRGDFPGREQEWIQRSSIT
jgi:hypothetical protein